MYAELCAIEIGWTWLAASAQRTGINVEAKILLFEYAFETLGVGRVDLKTGARNEQSRRAIERLGAQFEGVRRHWSQSHAPAEDGLLRDSAMFSVIASEWPATKATLRGRLARAAHRETALWPTAAAHKTGQWLGWQAACGDCRRGAHLCRCGAAYKPKAPPSMRMSEPMAIRTSGSRM